MHGLIPKHLSTKMDIHLSPQQKVFIQNYLTTHREELGNWERDFLLILFNSTHFSEQQRDTLEKIIKRK